MRNRKMKLVMVLLVCSAAASIAARQPEPTPEAATCGLTAGQTTGCGSDTACAPYGATCDTTTQSCICKSTTQTSCTLKPGDSVACQLTAECEPYGAVCNPNTFTCACAPNADGGTDLGVTPLTDAGVIITPGTGGGTATGAEEPPGTGSTQGPTRAAGCTFVP